MYVHVQGKGIFYRLVSDRVVSNTFGQYKGLIQALGTARRKKPDEKGYISLLAFADDTRHIEDIGEEFIFYQNYVNSMTNRLTNADEAYVEVMIEKEALRGAFKSLLPFDYIRNGLNREWDSIPYRNDSAI